MFVKSGDDIFITTAPDPKRFTTPTLWKQELLYEKVKWNFFRRNLNID